MSMDTIRPKGGIHDLFFVSGRRLHGRIGAVPPAHQACDFGTDGLLVELQRLLAAAAKGYVGRDPAHFA